jgi:hypothetical protein
MLNDKHGPIGKALQVRFISCAECQEEQLTFSFTGHSTSISRSVLYGRSARYATMPIVPRNIRELTVRRTGSHLQYIRSSACSPPQRSSSTVPKRVSFSSFLYGAKLSGMERASMWRSLAESKHYWRRHSSRDRAKDLITLKLDSNANWRNCAKKSTLLPTHRIAPTHLQLHLPKRHLRLLRGRLTWPSKIRPLAHLPVTLSKHS